MGHLVKTEIFDQGNVLEDSTSVNVPGWEGIWQAVEAEMERSGRIPNYMDDYGEHGCVTGSGHDCEREPDVCRENLRSAIRDFVRSTWEDDDLKTGSFYFSGADWSAVTVSWNGKTEDGDE